MGLVVAALPAVAEQPAAVAAAYLDRALSEMERHALRRDAVDWPKLRKEALAKAAGAKTTAETYGAIRFALASLGDGHSSLHVRGEATSGNGGVPASPFTGRYEIEGKVLQAGGKAIGYVVVPKCFPENERQFVAWETHLQGVIEGLARDKPSGWIIDLRGNVGGNMWPMLAGLGPLLGESDHLGEFFSTTGHSVWQYRNGAAAEIDDSGKRDAYPSISEKPLLLNLNVPVAILVDAGTSSSGEAIAIAFKGRRVTRFFGTKTAGLTSANEVYKLGDGATMWLTIGMDADRNGKQYPDGIEPDEVSTPGQDPVEIALSWLGDLAQRSEH